MTENFTGDQFRLHFLTHTTDERGYLDGARAALEGGCRWIQLRMKGRSDDEIADTARELLSLCRERDAKLILDDEVSIAREVGADGVHLGRLDMPIKEAREILGPDFIIGGTANTLDDIRRIARGGADYIGCGPFRFTTTKARLAPTLGLEGYRRLLSAMREEGITLPLVAIGGIRRADLPQLLEVGVDGVAVSGAILTAPDPVSETRDFITTLIHC